MIFNQCYLSLTIVIYPKLLLFILNHCYLSLTIVIHPKPLLFSLNHYNEHLIIGLLLTENE